MSAPGFRARAAADLGVQVVAFDLGGEPHACDVLLVEEIVTGQRVHPLPDVPGGMLGMLRLRGELVPVLDLSPLLRLRLRAREGHPPDVLVVEGPGGARVGVAVDVVHDVVQVPPGAYHAAPGGAQDARVAGLARVEGRLVTLLDLAEILREQTTSLPGGAP